MLGQRQGSSRGKGYEPGALAVDTLSLAWTKNHVLDLGSVLEDEHGILLTSLLTLLAGLCCRGC